MKLDDLKFYCVNCGHVFNSETIEKRKLQANPQYRSIFECSKCSEVDFQIYSYRTY